MPVEIPLTQGYVAIVDDVDADLAAFSWCTSVSSRGKLYAGRRTKERSLERLHRVIGERIVGRPLQRSERIDHRNGNGLDCKRRNLRLATPHQNNTNTKLRSNNTSGYKGVTRDKRTGRWCARINVNGQRINLGTHPTPEAAHRRYCDAARDLFGEFANFGGNMQPEYVILDTETTGLNNGLKMDQPVSIAVVSTSGEILFNRRIKPSVEIDEGAAAIHGITAESLVNEPTFGDIWPELEAILRGKSLAIYNASYDVRLLVNAAYAHGIILPSYPTRCIMREYASRFGVPNKQGSAKWWRLSAAFEHQYGHAALERCAGAHDAAADCLMTLDLMRRLDDGNLLTPQLEDGTRGAAFPVLLVSAQAFVTSRDNPYIKFTTAGGQSVSAFDGSGFDRFTKSGHPIAEWHKALSAKPVDYVHRLKTPIPARIVYETEWAELVSVDAAPTLEVQS